MSVMDPAALPLARKVLDKITTEPKSFNMDVWCESPIDDNLNPCGTTACLAGWTMILSGEYELGKDGFPLELEMMSSADIEKAGARLLGLPLEEVVSVIEGGRSLFYSSEKVAIQRLQNLISEAELAAA
ncbi:hypothetical protein FHT44_004926 [Mycolicibacterium sp. BK634]|uniref:hypothetical protein n=1 Tax=Mycolicibacterium sp. BK634 TaxID=2587099 RepID=UPI00160DAA20|nr:hypothetical protein [Mycolicibacterium sp. BK634]MBB3752414.1 hypothetical protein [Mycolicibacterium sp. BK634]